MTQPTHTPANQNKDNGWKKSLIYRYCQNLKTMPAAQAKEILSFQIKSSKVRG